MKKDWENELNNIYKLFNFIYYNINLKNNIDKKKIDIKISNNNLFIRSAIRHNFINNINNFMNLKEVLIRNKIKDLSVIHVKQLLALSAYNSLISKALNENNIPMIIYKGIILSLQTKRKISSRYCSDIDILIKEEDIKKTIIILKKLGFNIRYGFYKDNANSLIKKYFVYSRNAIIMTKKVSDFYINIDIHWSIITSCPSMLSFSELWNNRAIINLNGVKINTLNNYHSYLVLCYNSAKNKWNNISNLLDIALIRKELTINEKKELRKDPVVNKTNEIIYLITKDKENLTQSIKNESYLIKFVKQNQINHSKGTNKKKNINIWEKFSLTCHRIKMCKSFKDKFRVLITNLIPISVFINDKNQIIKNPILIFKKIFTKIYHDTHSFLTIK